MEITNNKIALITGATSGIGMATAKLLASNNFNLIITGRREELLDKLEAELLSTNDIMVYSLAFDVRIKSEVEKAFNQLPAEWQDVDVLINNAGLAVGYEDIVEGSTDDWEQMIDTNVKGLLYMSKVVATKMIARKSGHIVNLSSIAGKEAYKNGNVYCATKSAVLSLTQGMRLDFLKYGIKVSSICPGAVETDFSITRFHGDEERAAKVYDDTTPLYAEDIADAILFMVTRPAHVNIDDMLIMPTMQGLSREVRHFSDDK